MKKNENKEKQAMEKVNTGWQRKQEGATTDDFTWPLQTGPELGESSQRAHKNSVKSFFFFFFLEITHSD